jgi:hypothetical protein
MLLLVGTLAAAASLLAHPAAAAFPAPTLLTLRAAVAFDGVYTTSTGETVRISVSDELVPDEAENQAWAEFFATLPHGSELERVRIYFAPVTEVRTICGRGALACYSPQTELIVAPIEETEGQPSLTSILGHEYGHHLANSRLNLPWSGLSFGTKRWATYLDVCAGLEAGTFSMREYALDPAEGFAEAYRLLAERTLGLEQSPWEIVDPVFEPDETALALIAQDVADPWLRNTVLRLRGAKTRGFRFATPLDGRLTITLRAPRTSIYELRVPGAPIRRARGQGPATVSTAVCGTRLGTARVRLVKGKGAFQLTVSRP